MVQLEPQDLTALISYNTFRLHLKDATLSFPELKIKEKNGIQYLKGIFNIHNDIKQTVKNYLIEIHWNFNYPYRFPILLEVGGDIPNHIDWHKFSNEACCITVEPDEIIKCIDGVTIINFIKSYAVPFFANHIYRTINGKYKNGEYSHGNKALVEFYSNLFETNELHIWIETLRRLWGDKQKIRSNGHCFCSSGKKFEQCHKPILSKLQIIGKDFVIKDFTKIALILNSK